MDFGHGRVAAVYEVSSDGQVRLITLYPEGEKVMTFTDWRETILCYCAADAFQPEKLMARLQSQLDWNEVFRHEFEAVLAKGDLSSTDWTRNVNFHLGSDRDVPKWLRGIFNLLYFSGPAPNAPSL